MANQTKDEPQSYGSQGSWVEGTTKQNVNPPASIPKGDHPDFYESRHDAQGSAPHQGGEVSGVDQDSEGFRSRPEELAEQPEKKLVSARGGAKRESYFKTRDYPD